MGNFRKLNVWKESIELCKEIYKLTSEGQFSRDFGLRDQMRRSSVSIPSNIAEGDELDTNKQSVRFFYIAKGSCADLLTQLIIAKEINYICSEIFEALEDNCNKISAMLYKLIQSRSK